VGEGETVRCLRAFRTKQEGGKVDPRPLSIKYGRKDKRLGKTRMSGKGAKGNGSGLPGTPRGGAYIFPFARMCNPSCESDAKKKGDVHSVGRRKGLE